MERPPLIAVVDDDEDLRTALGDLLESIGYAARMYENADALITSGKVGTFDCIVSDIQMKGTSGLQLARTVRESDVPIILITAFPTPEVQQQAQAAGVRRLFIKPFNSQALIDDLMSLFG